MADVRTPKLSYSISGALFSTCVAAFLTRKLASNPFIDAAVGGHEFLTQPFLILSVAVWLVLTSATVALILEADQSPGWSRPTGITLLQRCIGEFANQAGLAAANGFLLYLAIFFIKPLTGSIARLWLPCEVVAWVAIMWAGATYKRLVPVQPTEGATQNKEPWVWPLICRFRRRATRHRIFAFCSQALILFGFAGGVALFVFADKIFVGQNYDNAFRTDSGSIAVADAVTNLENQLAKPGNVDSSDLKLLLIRVENYEAELKATADTHSTIISSIATRAGCVFLLYFLVQIFVTVYRFNIRLAGYYDARADVLQMLGSLEKPGLKNFVGLFSPEKLDFGKPPKGPAKEIVELLKTMAAATAAKGFPALSSSADGEAKPPKPENPPGAERK